MNTDDFEKHIQQQPPRTIPGAWRREILDAARRALPPRPVPETRPSWISTCGARFSAILAPWSRAWVGLGAVWAVIVALQLAARDREPVRVGNHTPPPEVAAALQQQRLLLSELVGESASAEALPPRRSPLQPRSEVRRESRMT